MEFGKQELQTAIEIKAFISQYGLPKDNFTMLQMSHMNGPQMNPIIQLCKSKFPGKTTWNFGDKYIFDNTGELQARTTGIQDTVAAFQPLLNCCSHFDMLYLQFHSKPPAASAKNAVLVKTAMPTTSMQPLNTNKMTSNTVPNNPPLNNLNSSKLSPTHQPAAAPTSPSATEPGNAEIAPDVSVAIQWWGGYNLSRQKAEDLIKAWFPGVSIQSRQDVGKTGNFEITVNEKLVHSKKTAGHGFLHENIDQQAAVKAAIEKVLASSLSK